MMSGWSGKRNKTFFHLPNLALCVSHCFVYPAEVYASRDLEDVGLIFVLQKRGRNAEAGIRTLKSLIGYSRCHHFDKEYID